MSGFVSRGQLRARKAPIRDAEILLDGQTVARTNDKGEFQLENLQVRNLAVKNALKVLIIQLPEILH